MLTRAENERTTRVTGDAPAARMMRSYWLPALWSEEVTRGAAVALRLFGEDLVARRDAAGELALASATGRVYLVREAGGFAWAYLGASERVPAFPGFDWTALPRDRIAHAKFLSRCNYLQALEGAMDSAHTPFLHRGFAQEEPSRAAISSDLAPRLETEDTPYGFRYAAIRRHDGEADRLQWVKTTLFVFPSISLPPRPMSARVPAVTQYFVPVDDEQTLQYTVFFSQNGEPLDEAALRREVCLVPGVDLDEQFRPTRNAANGWLQDRAAMKRGSWCGIEGFPLQDAACQESMGAIVDRSLEHLGPTDVAVMRLRRRILENIARIEAGSAPIGLDAPIEYPRLRSEQRVIPTTESWKQVGAFAGEFVA